MNRRVRTHCKSSSWKREEEEEVEKGFYRFLKPGALAQLRDSRISARSHQRRPNNLQISLLHIASNDDDDRRTTTAATQIEMIDEDEGGFPCFTTTGRKIYSSSPICPQRKKLVASKAIFFLSSDSDSSTDIDVLSNDTTDLLVSH